MKVVSIVCQKGSTAKTALAINLAVEAVAAAMETVIIDLDPQVSALDWARRRRPSRSGLAHPALGARA